MSDTESWRVDAACRDMPTSMFFPEGGGDTGAAARTVCAGCPVREQCLSFAVDSGERYGVWGGLSGQQRRLRNRRIKHGTRGGYMVHTARGETACDPCRAAHAAYKASRLFVGTTSDRKLNVS